LPIEHFPQERHQHAAEALTLNEAAAVRAERFEFEIV
jgi:hypothetical protein